MVESLTHRFPDAGYIEPFEALAEAFGKGATSGLGDGTLLDHARHLPAPVVDFLRDLEAPSAVMSEKLSADHAAEQALATLDVTDITDPAVAEAHRVRAEACRPRPSRETEQHVTPPAAFATGLQDSSVLDDGDIAETTTTRAIEARDSLVAVGIDEMYAVLLDAGHLETGRDSLRAEDFSSYRATAAYWMDLARKDGLF